jgi:peroxiredoxin
VIQVGAPAPAFRLPDTDGAPVALEDLRGRPALLLFLPAAFTQVCSSELGDLASVSARVERAGARALAIACDSLFVLRSWAEAQDLTRGSVTLLSDFWPHGDVSRSYDAFDAERGIATRTSYLIDADGTVAWSTASPAGVARDLEEHAAAVERLAERA